MRWSEPQRAMLREMGVRLWLPGTPTVGGEPGAATSGLAETISAAATYAPTASLVRAAAVAPDPASAAGLGASPSAAARPAPLGRPTAISARPSAAAIDPPRTAAAETVLALDWPALRAAVASCQACGLCESRRQTVFGVGHLRAHCMIVGGAPDEQEDACGEPFVGEPGQLLDRMLRALGLSREPAVPVGPEGEATDAARQVFIANTLKCRPPSSRNPTPQELSTCRPFLERQVDLVQPRVILALGPLAVVALLGSTEPIGKLRGRLHSWRGVPVVVTYHPVYLLRHLHAKAGAWEDLCLAASCLDTVPG